MAKEINSTFAETRIRELCGEMEYASDGLLTQTSINDLKAKLLGNNSHTDIHAGSASLPELMDPVAAYTTDIDPKTGRTIKSGKAINSQYPNERVQWSAIMDTLYSNAHDIGQALSYVENSEQIRLSHDCEPVIVSAASAKGYARVGSFIHDCDMQTYATVVLSKDTYNKETNFSVLTAYPGVAAHPAKQTAATMAFSEDMTHPEHYPYMTIHCRDNTSIVRQTQTFKDAVKNGDRITQINLLTRANPAAIYGTGDLDPNDVSLVKINNVKTNPTTSTSRFSITKENPDDHTRLSCVVQDNDVLVQRYSTITNKPVPVFPTVPGAAPDSDNTPDGFHLSNSKASKAKMKQLDTIAPDFAKTVQSAYDYMNNTPPPAGGAAIAKTTAKTSAKTAACPTP